MSSTARVLIVTPLPEPADELSRVLEELALDALCVSGKSALFNAVDGLVELIVLELDEAAPRETLALLEELQGRGISAPVLVIVPERGAFASADLLSLGVVDILERPFGREQARRAFERALALSRAASDDSTGGASLVPMFIGDSKPMQHVDALLRRAAPTDSTVLVRGESGTGKELLARAVHELSKRRKGPLVKVHCAALPDTLLESELFGYERGAFTGALSTKPGRVELAQSGTLFLDEIGDITPAVQVKLLRLLQDREFEHLGGKRVLKADVRFVAATHRDLEGMTKLGTFREDLFYRLNVITLWVPPLRARRSDIPPLAELFCGAVARLCDRPELRLAPEALELLRLQRWPGNIRELQNFVERLVVLSDGPIISADDVKRELAGRTVTFLTQTAEASPPSVAELSPPSSTSGRSSAESTPPNGEVQPLSHQLHAAERRALQRALDRTSGNRTLAARVLGVSRATLYKKLQEHGLS